MKSPLLRLARIALLVYVGLCIGIAGCQSKMLYFPAKHTEPAELDAKRTVIEAALVRARARRGEAG